MSTLLEDTIREAASNGRLHGLTLFGSSSPGGRWQGNARWEGNLGWTVEHSNDPVAALLAALKSTERYDHGRSAPESVAEPVLTGGLFD